MELLYIVTHTGLYIVTHTGLYIVTQTGLYIVTDSKMTGSNSKDLIKFKELSEYGITYIDSNFEVPASAS